MVEADRGRAISNERVPASWSSCQASTRRFSKDGEALVWVNNGGGGYGDPKRRAPERVAADVNRNWLTAERAREVYGVALKPAQTPGLVAVDVDATIKLRTAV